MVAAKGGAQHAVRSFYFGRDKYCSHGEPIANAFGTSNDVGANVEMLVSKELTRTAIAALYLVADKQCAVCVTSFAQALHKFFGSHANTAYTLNALDDDDCYIALAEFGLKGREVVERQEGDVAIRVDGGNDTRIVRCFNC